MVVLDRIPAIYKPYTSGREIKNLEDVTTSAEAWDYISPGRPNIGRTGKEFPLEGIARLVEDLGLLSNGTFTKNLQSTGNCLLTKGRRIKKSPRARAAEVVIYIAKIVKRFKKSEQGEALEKIREAYCSNDTEKYVGIPDDLNKVSKGDYELTLGCGEFQVFLNSIKESKMPRGNTEKRLASVAGEKYVSWIASPDNPNNAKKWFKCLKCGRRLWTDRCHRFHKKCRERNEASPDRHAYQANLPSGTTASFE